MLRWGLVPFWAKDLKVGTKMINARAEGVETKPAFREAVTARRCIVPATGFFEWQGEPGPQAALRDHAFPTRPLFAFAGLWERWKPRRGRSGRDLHHRHHRRQRGGRAHPRPHAGDPAADAEDTWLIGAAEEARALLKPYAGPSRRCAR